MAFQLPKRAALELPHATDDEAHALLVADPTITQFHGNMNVIIAAPTPVLTAAAPTTAANNAEVLVNNTGEHWINNKWRPLMGWMYMTVCITDFILFPIGWSLLQAISRGTVTIQWQPLTLQGAGLFHIAMGAVLGITAYGRTKEKLDIAGQSTQ